jgi:hypothetical protein
LATVWMKPKHARLAGRADNVYQNEPGRAARLVSIFSSNR